MILTEFRIKNYRSIIDTGWQQLATDHITGLIGQNESGKTSVLEALYSFYTDEINDDILRADLSMPEVSCTFEVPVEEVKKHLKDKKVPEGLMGLISNSGSITLTRNWDDQKNAYLSFGDDTVQNFFRKRWKEKTIKDKEQLEEIKKTVSLYENTETLFIKVQRELADSEKELSQLLPKLKKLQKSVDRSPNQDKEKALQAMLKEKLRLEKRIEKKKKTFESRGERIEELSPKASYSRGCLEVRETAEKIRRRMDKIRKDAENLEAVVGSTSTSRSRKMAHQKLGVANQYYLENNQKFQKLNAEAGIRQLTAIGVIHGKEPEVAEEEARREYEESQGFYSQEEIAEILFQYIPVFELFEDFSSLLPNRIDLEDLLTENTTAEGYKAARNFLLIAGLDAKFFSQKNNRILKQKIELLNNDLTINFQDYWRQNVGKNNKIRLNFELEHYDFNNPEKMGQPFLEFWIKDKQDRLYPKQRSRGVRWFLSFYLELKASAMIHEGRSRIFLIDEPALSLHARAQEDVLKVFEDIKEDIQIVYTTHSPHLIDSRKIYRLLAVQRDIENDLNSDTRIFNAASLSRASSDTLSPIYTMMGARLADQQFIQRHNNIIVKDTATYHYLSTLLKMADFEHEYFILPSTGLTNIPLLANMLMGWKLDYIVLLDHTQKGKEIASTLKKTIYANNTDKANKKILIIPGIYGLEDLFSTLDFKKHILRKRVGIPEKNTEYLELENVSRDVLATEFVLYTESNKLTIKEFDKETQSNIQNFTRQLEAMLVAS